ncbi:MAG: AsmA-like C-terminal region-containing protein [Chitinophagaceae bacterium]
MFFQNKLIKKISFAVIGLIALYLLLLTAVSIYVATHKTYIISTIQSAVKNNIQSNFVIKDADVSVWKSFPKIEVALKNVSITDSLYNLPFLQMQEMDFRIGILDVMGKQTDINTVKLKNGLLHFFKDSAGYSNAYVITPKKKANTNAANNNKNSLFINNITLENVHIISENKKLQKLIDLQFHQLNADVEKKDSLLYISMSENCLVKGLGFDLSKGSFLNNQTIEGNWNIQLNSNNNSFSFNKTKLYFNKHAFEIEGAFYLNKTAPHFNLNVKTDGLSFQQAEQLLPQNVQRKLSLFNLTKPLNVTAFIGGSLLPKTNPLVNVKWVTEKNDLTTPVVSFNDCNFNGMFTNELTKGLPLTDENSAIIFNNFLGKWGNINLAGRNIIIKNLTSATIQFEFVSQCTFKQLDETLALNTVHFTDGKAQIYFKYNGPLLTDALQINKLTLDMQLQNGTINYAPRNLTFTNCNGEVLLSQNFLQINNLQCDVKQNHFVVNVAGNQLGNLITNDTSKANITCSVFTPSLNIADFQSLFSQQVNVSNKKAVNSPSSVTSNVDSILENGNLQLNIKANKILLNKFIGQNAQAQLLFQQNDWRIQQASLEHGDGKLNLNAKLHMINSNYHQATANVQVQNVDIRKLFYAFNNFGQNGIEYQNLKGIVNSNSNINFNIDSKGKVVSKTLQGTVNFSIKNGALLNYEPLQKIKDFVFQDRDLKNIQFAELKDKLDIDKTEIYIHRMEIESTVFTAFVEGTYSLQNNTDISIQVPLSNLKTRDENYDPKNKGTKAKVGSSIYLRARSDKNGGIKFGLDLFRRFRKKT